MEIENLRTGWDWAVDQGRIKDIDRSLESLAEFYRIRGWFQEGEQAFARAAQRLAGEQSDIESRPEAGRESRIVLGKVLMQQGRFCGLLGLEEKRRELLQESLVVFRGFGARREMAYALYELGDAFFGQGEEKPLYQEGLAIFKEIGDQRGVALSLRGLGWAATYQGEYGAAKQLFQESLTIFRELGNQEAMANSQSNVGYISWVLGEYREAKQIHQESLALCREIGDQRGVTESLGHLAVDACGLREYEEAKQLWQESLAICREIGDLPGAAGVLGNLGELANVLGEYAEAIQLAQESLALSKRLDNQRLIAWCFRVLGDAVCGLGDLAGARRYFHQALETDISVQGIPFGLLALVAIAALLAAEGEKERALEILTLAIHHPASLQLTKDRAAPLVAELEAELPPDVVAAAQERGRARDLEATVAELLVELAE